MLLANVGLGGVDRRRHLGGAGVLWLAGAALAGLLLAAAAILIPAWSDARRSTVVAARAVVGHGHTPLWQRLWLDLVLLAIAAVVFWRTASSGYQVVLAPEGVANTAVDYQAFIAPVCLVDRHGPADDASVELGPGAWLRNPGQDAAAAGPRTLRGSLPPR